MSTDDGGVSGLGLRLLDYAVELSEQTGPGAVSLREVQRRAGVSAAAAYRHFKDRDALLVAVGRRASRLLANDVASAMQAVEGGGGPGVDVARRRLRAGCMAYLDFAARRPGLYRAVFLTGESPARLSDPVAASSGVGGRGPFQLLQDALADLARAVGNPGPTLPWTDTAVWAACHGMATLLLDSPLRHLGLKERGAAADRLLDMMLNLDGGLAPTP